MTQDYSSSDLQSTQKEITNLDQLAESLAEQTRFISDNIMAGIGSKSREYKTIMDFSQSVKKHLIHDLSDEEFADLYAQTITFGLFTAVIMAKGKRNQDPLIHFYETFLSKYNPNLREKRGVYYTPRPVVSFIVKSIHLLLQEKFLIAGGLANHDSIILDPAAGTSAFLWEAVNLAVYEFASRYGKGIAEITNHKLQTARANTS